MNEVMNLAGCDSWIGLKRASKSSPWTWTDGSSYGVDDLGRSGTARNGGGKELWEGNQGRDNVCGRWGWGTAKVWDDVPCTVSSKQACFEHMHAARSLLLTSRFQISSIRIKIPSLVSLVGQRTTHPTCTHHLRHTTLRSLPSRTTPSARALTMRSVYAWPRAVTSPACTRAPT